MNNNLQIFIFINKIKELIQQSNLPIGTVYLILKNLEFQIKQLYLDQVNKELKQYQNQIQQQQNQQITQQSQQNQQEGNEN